VRDPRYCAGGEERSQRLLLEVVVEEGDGDALDDLKLRLLGGVGRDAARASTAAAAR
jgi:hypothetical protein